VIDTFFAIPFSDLFRSTARWIFFRDGTIYKPSFRDRKQLKDERIHDHIMQFRKIDFMFELSRERLAGDGKSLANLKCDRESKKRSPSVWRN
jgi:hypothetical protein